MMKAKVQKHDDGVVRILEVTFSHYLQMSMIISPAILQSV